MKILLNKKILALAIFLSAVLASHAYAQVEFPIAELGNCANREECKAYCDTEENFASCRGFASRHNLRGKSESEEKFEIVREDGGPGGCAKNSEDPMESCRTYCDTALNMKECVAYAKKHNLMQDEELEEAEKVLKALEGGAKLPDGCKNKDSCHKVCEEPEDISVARQCFAFAEAAGLLPPGVSRDQAEKMFKAIEEGRAPFKSPKDFEQCENPSSDEIMEKCVNFALENGFISGDEAEMVRKTGGKGPGGCRGKEQCEEYCEANQDECFTFAEEHGLIREEDKTRMEEGRGKLKEGLSQAPAEVKECLEIALGADTLEQILSGQKRPTEELGEKMRSCFEQSMGGDAEDRGGPFEREFPGRGEGSGREHPPGMEGGDNRTKEFETRIFRGEFDEKRTSGEFPGNLSEEEIKRMMEERGGQMQFGETERFFDGTRPGMMDGNRMPPPGEMRFPDGENFAFPPEGYPTPPSGEVRPTDLSSSVIQVFLRNIGR